MDPYKVARFARGKIPAALRKQHQLKDGVRAELVVCEGAVVFVDHRGERRRVNEGEMVEVLPALSHHLDQAEDAAIEIRFFRTADS